MDIPTSHLPEGFEARLPAAEECSLGHILQQRALTRPDEIFVKFESGEEWDSARAFAECRGMAAILAALGVRPGDMVVNWLPNGPDHLRVLFALSMLGAVEVPINVAHRGKQVANALAASGAQVMVCHPRLVERLAETDRGALATVLLPGAGEAAALPGLAIVNEGQVTPESAVLVRLNQPWDLLAIIFTSGTTGPAKGVRTTYAQQWTAGRAMYPWVGAQDRMLVHHPLFHVAALSALFSAVSVGGTLAISEPVRVPEFWDTVRRLGVSAVNGLGNVAAGMLLAAPARADDRDHAIGTIGFTHVDPALRAFAARFGVHVVARYSMSETSCVTTSEVDTAKDRTVGKLRKGLTARIVDEHDLPLPLGATGELVLRADLPWVLNDGYLANPEATCAAWRGGWFHTGDLLRCDAEGDLFYVGRKKDAIRRRGENISAHEVELELLEHPAIGEAVVIGVGPESEQEVLAIVAPHGGETIDPAALLAFLGPRLAHFMLPRYVRVMAALPKLETGKPDKVSLRAEGLTAGCWDREAAGIVIRRTRLDA